MDKQNVSCPIEKKERKEDTDKNVNTEILGRNIFDHLRKIIQEEKQRTQQKFEDLSTSVEELKKNWECKFTGINECTEHNFKEFQYFSEELKKNMKQVEEQMSYFKHDIQNINQQILQLHKKDDENLEVLKSDIKTLFDKIKTMLSILNERGENVKEELNNYKEFNELESKRKYENMLKLINDETENINKKREASISVIHSNINQMKEFSFNFQKNVEKSLKDINDKIDNNKKEIEEQINELKATQKKILTDIYSSLDNINI